MESTFSQLTSSHRLPSSTQSIRPPQDDLGELILNNFRTECDTEQFQREYQSYDNWNSIFADNALLTEVPTALQSRYNELTERGGRDEEKEDESDFDDATGVEDDE